MAWKDIFRAQPRNLSNLNERQQALLDAKQAWMAIGFSEHETNEYIGHERQHLEALPEYDPKTGRKLSLRIQQENGTRSLRMVVRPNRLFTRRELRIAAEAVTRQSQGDQKAIKTGFLRARKR